MQLLSLKAGERVRFTEPHDIFPITVVAAGTHGTVMLVSDDVVAILPDDKGVRHDLVEWDGEIHLYPADWLNGYPLERI